MSSHRTFLPLFVFGALSLGATLAAPARAQSCTDPDIVHTSYPVDRATGVPTNTPIYVYGPELAVGTHDVTLEDESGTDVSLQVEAAEGGLLVDPIFGLEPGTSYELTVAARSGGSTWSATFDTGTGPATPVQLEPPDVTLSVIDWDSDDCGAVSAICVNNRVATSTIPTRMTVEVLVGDEVLSVGGGQPVPAYPAGGGAIGPNECIEARLREPGGNVSQAIRVCGDNLWRFELEDGAAAPTSCQPFSRAPSSDEDDGGGEESGGCTLSAPGAAAGGVASGGAGLALLLGALLGLRRRPRSR